MAKPIDRYSSVVSSSRSPEGAEVSVSVAGLATFSGT